MWVVDSSIVTQLLHRYRLEACYSAIDGDGLVFAGFFRIEKILKVWISVRNFKDKTLLQKMKTGSPKSSFSLVNEWIFLSKFCLKVCSMVLFLQHRILREGIYPRQDSQGKCRDNCAIWSGTWWISFFGTVQIPCPLNTGGRAAGMWKNLLV